MVLTRTNCSIVTLLSVDTLDMLTSIETRIEELIDYETTMPPDKVRAAQKDLERLRRQQEKEEMEQEKRKHQQMRNEKALER